MKKSINLFKLILKDIVYFTSFFFPKKKNLWVFGAWFGEKFSDNSKYLFQYIATNHPEIQAVWLTKNKQTFNFLRKQGFECYYLPSAKGIITALRAKAGVISTSLTDICEYAAGNTKIIQLWHGTPLKKIMNDDTLTFKKTTLKQKLSQIVFPFFKSDYSKALIVSPSQEVSEIFSSAFLAKKTSIKLTGYPRNDSFFMPHDTSFPLAQQLQLLKKEQCSIGIYMPTHRQEGKSEIFSLFYSALPQLNKTLKQLNTALFVKLHFYHNQSTGTEQTVSFSNIFFIKDEDINQDIYNLLPYTDFLITDYSSIYFDYLLTDKPIIFTPFDIQEYITKDRTFYFDYTAVTPGPKASDWNEVSEYIKKFKQTPSFFSKERSALCARFNKYCEGKACQRVYFEVMKFLYPNHNEK